MGCQDYGQTLRICRISLSGRLFITTAFLLWLVLFAVPGRADVTADAKLRFEEGVRHFQDEDYPMAIAAFEASYRLRKSAIVLFNIGMCQKAMFRFAEAVQTFQTLLTRYSERVTALMAQDIAIALKDIKHKSGSVRVENLPEKVTMSIDGRLLGEGPFSTPLLLSPGRHIVTLSLEGQKTKNISISVKRGVTVTVDGRLKIEKATLRVICPKGATAYLNDAGGRPCPYSAIVEPGRFEVTTRAPGKETSVEVVEVREGETATLVVQLEDSKTTSNTGASSPKTSVSHRRHDSRHSKGLLISGIASVVLGIAGMAVGIGFHVADIREYEDVLNTINKNNSAITGGDTDAYHLYHSDAVEKSEKYEDEIYPRNKKAVIMSYTMGGVLTATGISLIVGHTVKKRDRSRVTVHVSPVCFWGSF